MEQTWLVHGRVQVWQASAGTVHYWWRERGCELISDCVLSPQQSEVHSFLTWEWDRLVCYGASFWLCWFSLWCSTCTCCWISTLTIQPPSTPSSTNSEIQTSTSTPTCRWATRNWTLSLRRVTRPNSKSSSRRSCIIRHSWKEMFKRTT